MGETDQNTTRKRKAPGIRAVRKALEEKIEGINKELEKKEKKGKKAKKEEEEVTSIEDKNATYKMLADMRSAYRSAGGAKKLIKLIKGDDKLLLAMVKELMKVEASLMATEIKNKDTRAGGNKVTFVIIKGLHDELPAEGESEVIDMGSLADAINPLAVPKIEYKEEIERP